MKKLLVFVAALAVGLAGCASGGGGGAPNGIDTLVSGNHSSVTDQDYKDFHNAVDLNAYLAKAFAKQSSPPKLPDVDWTKQMVLTAFIGQQKNSGYRIRFLSADDAADGVHVHVRIIIPCNEHAKSGESTPYQIVTAPATSKTVTYEQPEQEYEKC